MDIGSLLLGLALLVVIAFLVAQPLLENNSPRDEPASPADELLFSRERVLAQLRDLDFDAAMGKLNPEDFAAQRAQLVAEGVAILKQLDALGIAAGDTGAASAEPALTPMATEAGAADSDEIEAAVAQLRARRAAPAKPAKSRPAALSLDAEIEANVAQRRAASPAAGRVDEKLACAQCGTEVRPNDRFCPKCGSPLLINCPNCGQVARAGDRFCAHCGQSLPAPATAALPARQAKVRG